MTPRFLFLCSVVWIAFLVIAAIVLMFAIENRWANIIVAEMVAVLVYMSLDRVWRYCATGEWL